MKARMLILALTVSVGVAHAQYFQKTYYSNAVSNDNGRKGANAVVSGNQNLYLQTGSSITTTGKAPMVSATDFNGAPVFCKTYPLVSNWAGSTVSGTGQAIAHDPGTGNIIVVGDFTTSPVIRNGIFCMTLDAAGNVIAGSVKYFLQPTVSKKLYVSAVRVLNGGTQILACGSAESSMPNSFNPWVMRYDMAVAVGWFRIYDEVSQSIKWNSVANDVIESSFNGTPEIAVVGQSLSPNAEYQGFLMRVNTSGTMLSFNTYDSGVTGADDRFTAITRCNSLTTINGVGTGYVIAGSSNTFQNSTNPNYRSWMIRINQFGTLVGWSNTYNYLGTTNSYLYGIVERINTSNNYEYYATGHAVVGLLGGSDAMVIKVTDLGVTGPLNGFSYGSTANEYGVSIDQANNTAFPGITVYGQKEVSAGNFDFYMVKAYYNGRSRGGPFPDQCGEIFYEPLVKPMTVLITYFSSTNTTLTPTVVGDPTPVLGMHLLLCNINTISSGSNARTINTGESPITEFAIHAFPNPVNASSELQVNVDVPEDNMVHLMLVDMLGKTIWSADQELVAGTTTINIPLPQLPAGLYNLSVANATETKSTLISVK